jgi:type II secretory pathway component PulJ
METGKIIKYSIIALFAFVFVGIFSSVISTSNEEVDLRNRFKQKMDERTAFYDKMWKTISQKSQIAIKNDSSFTNNINIIMAGRKDAQGIFMKWVQESNPNANYEAVSSLYADLSRAVEGQRDGFFMEEKMIQGIVLEHDNIMSKFPSGFILSMFGRSKLVYKPITSDRTDGVIQSGKDNDVNVF